jgi:hypothetical protein
MFRANFHHLSSAITLLAAAGLSAPAAAQVDPIGIPQPGGGAIIQIPIPIQVIRLPCCRCIDGSSQVVNISTGTVAWRVSAPNGADAQAVAVPNRPASWTTALAPAQWAAHPAGSALGNHVFLLRFYVPRCVIPPRVQLAGRSAADNRQIVFLDNVPLASFQNASGLGFTTANIVSFAAPLPPIGSGTHVIRVLVNNISGPSGLLFSATLTVICPTNPEIAQASDPGTAPAREGVEAVPAL